MANYLRHSYEHLDINSKCPFSNDTLQRLRFSNLLTNIVSNYSNGFVMAINGAWGTGKTVFMRQWKYALENKGYRVTIFNAWDNDYFGEPTLAILSQFTDFFNEGKSLPEKAISAWKTLQSVPQIAIKGVITKRIESVIGEDAVNEISNTYKANEETAKEYRNSDIAKYLSQRIEFTKYQNALIEFAAATSEKDKPLVFIIDELDRCSPSYAVEVLEKIKHLFSIPNIVFCLAIDKEQLKKTIQGHYGAYNFNAEEYLRRFFDIELDLPPIQYQEFASLLATHFELKSYFQSEEDLCDFIVISAESAEKQHLTLRQLEKYFAHAKLVFSSYRTDGAAWLVAVILILYKFSNEFFNQILNRELRLEDYAYRLKMHLNFKEFSRGPNVLGALLYHIEVYLKEGHIVQIPNDFKFEWTSDFTEEELETISRCYVAESQIRYRASSLERIVSKICFIEQFISR